MTHGHVSSFQPAAGWEERLVRAALDEDSNEAGDITSKAVIPADATASATIAAREAGRIAGLEFAEAAFRLLDPTMRIERLVDEGADVEKGAALIRISGNARALLAGERVALNFLGRLCGIATLTRDMARAALPHKAKIAATRKTTPLLRAAEKYAVTVGGGLPHRFGLFDAILIKDNHIAFAGGIAPALRAATGKGVSVEIEVDTLAQLREVLDTGGADIVLLDNMSLEDMAEAVRLAAGRVVLEASGGVTLARVPLIAATGVDVISSGAITHSVKCLDVGLDAE
jgi:nicotinate-nucleotide pyrophosphorylase (carboxylating)